MDAQQKLEKLQYEARQFQEWQSAPQKLAEFEAELKRQAEEQKLEDAIADLSEKLDSDLARFRERKRELDEKLISFLWTVKTIVNNRITLSESTKVILYTSQSLAHTNLVEKGNLPQDVMGLKIEISMLSEQELIDRTGSAKLMTVPRQDDQIIDSLLSIIGRFTNDIVVVEPDNQNSQHSQFVMDADNVGQIVVK